MSQSWIFFCLDCGQKTLFHHPEAQMLPCEVRCGVPYLISDDNDQPITTSTDVGSEFEVIPRLDGKGADIVIIGTTPDQGNRIEKNDSDQSNTLVTLSEVASPASGTSHPLLAGAIVRDKFLAHSTSLGAQHPSGGDSSGRQAIGGGDSSDGYTDSLDDCFGAVASGIFRHELTHKPTDPHCEACQRGK
jgi:hypothetical protein